MQLVKAGAAVVCPGGRVWLDCSISPAVGMSEVGEQAAHGRRDRAVC